LANITQQHRPDQAGVVVFGLVKADADASRTASSGHELLHFAKVNPVD
jgi:hypothetical protein